MIRELEIKKAAWDLQVQMLEAINYRVFKYLKLLV